MTVGLTQDTNTCLWWQKTVPRICTHIALGTLLWYAQPAHWITQDASLAVTHSSAKWVISVHKYFQVSFACQAISIIDFHYMCYSTFLTAVMLPKRLVRQSRTSLPSLFIWLQGVFIVKEAKKKELLFTCSIQMTMFPDLPAVFCHVPWIVWEGKIMYSFSINKLRKIIWNLSTSTKSIYKDSLLYTARPQTVSFFISFFFSPLHPKEKSDNWYDARKKVVPGGVCFVLL